MLSVADALRIVLDHARPLPVRKAPLLDALGRVLAEDVTADRDSPPFAKALMDGFAVRAPDLASGPVTLRIVEEITAGRTPTQLVGPGEAARIMTGAPMPDGADAVVMVERTTVEGDRVTADDAGLKPGQNVLPRGREMRAGETVLATGTVVRPPEIGVLAGVGRATVTVVPRPRVAVMTTGDEVVPLEQTPAAGQIRDSNSPMMLALVASAGCEVLNLGIAPDTPAGLRERIAAALDADVALMTGGVSMGKLDLVPGTLAELGVVAHFHKVALKPGKPLLFGTRGLTLVFALPGNPVSSLVGFELFVRPALRALAGHSDPGPHWRQVPLAEAHRYATDRPTYHPAHWDGSTVRPVAWFGSPDLRGVTNANALMLFPAGDLEFAAGRPMAVLPLAPRDW